MTYVVVHIRCSEQVNTHVVGELDLVDIRAVRLDVGSIINVVVCVHQSNILYPIPNSFRVLGVGIVIGVSGKSSTEIEEAAVRDRVLVIVSGEIWVYLPSQAVIYQHKTQIHTSNEPTLHCKYCQV